MLKPLSLLSATAILLTLGLSSTASAQLTFSVPELRASGSREAADRSTCAIAGGSPLTAILPETNVGVTLQAQPTLFIYIPRNNAQQGVLQIYEADSETKTLAAAVELPPSVAPGDYQYGPAIAAVTLDGLALASGTSYRWTLALVCDPSDRSQDIEVSGMLLRAGESYLRELEPELQATLSDLPAANDAIARDAIAEDMLAYAEAGVWHDMLTRLVSLAKVDPSYTGELNHVLTEQGLGAIASASVVSVQLRSLR